MNTQITYLLKMILLTLLVISISFSQEIFDKQLTIYNQVKQLIDARYGQGLDFEYTMVDAQIYYSRDEKIQDLYGTLSGCVLFSAYRYSSDAMPDTFIVGMVKGGQIIWDNFPGSEKCLAGYGVYGELLYSQDLNNDGEIDLLFLRHHRTSPGDGIPFATYINILSWDGTKGKFISGEMAGSAECELIDTDGDGIMEIRTKISDMQIPDDFKTSTYPYITYGWNGAQYGLWSSVRQVPESDFIPANRFQATVNCKVERINNNFIYTYAVSNHLNSKQKIEWIGVEGIEDASNYYAPSPWSSGTSIIGGRRFDLDFDKMRSAIKPGKTLNGFTTKSVALPMIVKYYLQGYSGHICCSTEEQARQNILTNSVTGYTLGTRDTSNVIGNLEWYDTLSSYTTQSRTFGWITTQTIANKYLNYFSTAKTQLQTNNTSGARTTLQQVLTDVNIDSSSTPATQTAGKLTSEAYALLRFNTEYLISKLPAPTTPYLNIALKNSTGTKLTGGTLQYYDASPNGAGWKDAVNNNDGTFSINTTKTSLSLRMTYGYGSQQKNNIPINSDTVIFQTVNAQVQLRNSNETLLDTGIVQYYAGAWRTFGTTSNGIATKELLASNYSFRMTYGYASIDTVQDISANPTVVFKTTNAQVQLKNSQGNLIDQGTVQYYAGAWRTFGATTNGIATKELLPTNYSFRMTYAYASSDKVQNIGSNNTVLFSTVLATVSVKNLQNNPVNNAIVTYYSGAWRSFGTTVNGETVKELLPINLQFRSKLGTTQADKTQNLSTNPLVEIQLNVAQ